MTPRLAAASRPDDVDFARDRALVERCQHGDAGAFDDLYLRYYARLVRFCMRRLGDSAEAEDAAQEAFARAWRAMPNFDGEKRFYPWLSVIASNLCVDIVRRSKRTTPVEDDKLDLAARPVDGGQETLVVDRADHELIVKALGRVSPRYREVLQLREANEWTYQQIAQHKGVQVSTIETLLYRARHSLKREYLLLADGRLGVAGFLAVLGKLLSGLVPHSLKGLKGLKGKAAGAKVPGATPAGAGAGAPVVGLGAPAATATGAGVGLASTAAVAATVIAVGALAVVASLLPHSAASKQDAQPTAARSNTVAIASPTAAPGRGAAHAGRSSVSAVVGAVTHAGKPAGAGSNGVSGITLPTPTHISAPGTKVASGLPAVAVSPPRKLNVPTTSIDTPIDTGTLQAGIVKAIMTAGSQASVPAAKVASTVTQVTTQVKAPVKTAVAPATAPVKTVTAVAPQNPLG